MKLPLPSGRSIPKAYWFRTDDLLSILGSIRNDNAQGEYYLTDAVPLDRTEQKRGAYIASDPAAVMAQTTAYS